MNLKCIFAKFKRNVWRIAFILLGLCLLASHFASQYAARYVSGDFSGDDARVAIFDFTVTSELTAGVERLHIQGMKPGDTKSYEVTITNKSEIAIQCTVSAQNVTESLRVTMSTVQKEIAIGESTTITFVIEWDLEKNSLDFMGKSDVVQLTVDVSQID